MADDAQNEILVLLQPLTPMQQRLFACDCAAHVLPLFACIFPHDDCPRTAIAATRADVQSSFSASSI